MNLINLVPSAPIFLIFERLYHYLQNYFKKSFQKRLRKKTFIFYENDVEVPFLNLVQKIFIL